MAIQSNIKESMEIEETNLQTSAAPSMLPDPVKKNIIYAGVAIGVVVLAVIGIFFYRNSAEKKQVEADLALSRVQNFYETGDYAKALNGDPSLIMGGQSVIGLKKIAKDYEGTEPGKLAALYAGNALAIQNNYTEAQEYYTIAEGADADLTKMGAMAGLAAVKDKAGQYKDAAELYKKAADIADKTGNKEFYQLSAALLYEKANDKNEAIKLYREIVASNEFSEFAGEAKAGILRLGETLE